MAVPTVTISPITAGFRNVTIYGTIAATGGSNITEFGWQLGETTTADRTINQTGLSLGAGFVGGQNFENLIDNYTYWGRCYAVNADGTGYSAWQNFTTPVNSYAIEIDGVDRTTAIINQSIQISDIVNDQQNTCTFQITNLDSNGIPSPDEEVIITSLYGTRLFGGYITQVIMNQHSTGQVYATVSCVDYVRLLDRNLVNKTYTDQTDKAIIEDIIATYCSGFGITTTNVLEGVTIDQINFNYIQPSQALRRIADLTGRNWYIDYEKDIHYFALTDEEADYEITTDELALIKNLTITKDSTQIKNRVYVRGGTNLSDPTTYATKGDGISRKFLLPDKPHSVTIDVNGTPKTLGIKNVDTSGYQYYLNFQEKYIEQDTGQSILATTDTLTVTYSYDIPILVAVENAASILEHGQQEFAIFDKSITTQQAARDRASAELIDYAANIVEASFSTYISGFRSGQTLPLLLEGTDYNVDDNYIITQVIATSIGGGKYEYEIKMASAKTMGIIRFLIELLEANKNLIEVNDQEVVDNLLVATDALNGDSLLDSLTIDSAGPYSTWCTDSLQSTPITRARWDLFQWWG